MITTFVEQVKNDEIYSEKDIRFCCISLIVYPTKRICPVHFNNGPLVKHTNKSSKGII